MEEIMSLEGPVLKVNGQLILLIRLDTGGSEFVDGSQGLSEVSGEYLKVMIPEWLAGVLQIEEGDLVYVNNSNGQLDIRPSKPRPVH